MTHFPRIVLSSSSLLLAIPNDTLPRGFPKKIVHAFLFVYKARVLQRTLNDVVILRLLDERAVQKQSIIPC